MCSWIEKDVHCVLSISSAWQPHLSQILPFVVTPTNEQSLQYCYWCAWVSNLADLYALPCCWLGRLASAQPHALLLAHTHKEGFQLPFSFDVDESSALTGVAQLLQHVRRFLRYLEVHTENNAQMKSSLNVAIKWIKLQYIMPSEAKHIAVLNKYMDQFKS